MDFYDAWDMSGRLQYLKVACRFVPVKGEEFILETLNGFLASVKKNNVNSGLEGSVSYWIKKLNDTYKLQEILRPEDVWYFEQDIHAWIGLVAKELANRPCWDLTQPRALDQKALLEASGGKPSAFFDEQIWNKLPMLAKSDFSDSAKCLLIGASTPAAMVALRGAEAVVREFCKFKTGQESRESMGIIIRKLRVISGINPRLLNYMDYLRSEKRNLAQHPDKIFSQREAERIFMEIINAVHDIYAEMLGS